MFIRLDKSDGTHLFAVIDVQDFDLVNSFEGKWYSHYNRYTRTFYCQGTTKIDGKRATLHLHRLIMSPETGYFVDHIDGDTLNNHRSNLKIVTRSENGQNMRNKTRRTIRGVHWNKRYNVWEASLCVDRRDINLGRFDNVSDAEKAVKSARAQLMPHSPEARGIGMEGVPIIPLDINPDGFGPMSRNKSGYRGVSWKSSRNRWRVQFTIDGRTREFGLFKDLQDAIDKANYVKQQYGIAK